MENTNKSHTSRSIFINVLYGISTWILPLVLTFFSTPIILKSLGNEDYGIYALVLGLVAYSFNLSFGRAITKYISEFRASGENERIRDVISATLFINLTVGFVVVVSFFAAANYLTTDVFQIKAEDQPKTILAIYIAALSIFFLLLNQVFNSILQGIHRFDVYSKITNFNSAAIISGNILLAYNGYSLIALFLWNLMVTVVTGILFLASAKKHLPEFGINFRFQKETVKTVLKFSAGVIGHQIMANLFVLFERGWVTRKLGAENLTYYIVPMSLSVYIHSFISSIVLVTFPLASQLKNEPEKLLRLYTKATKVVCFLVVFIALSVIVHSRDFLTLWLSAAFAEKSWMLLIIHTVTFSLLAILTVSWNMTEGLGYPQFNSLIYGVCLAINTILIFVLTSDYGNLGIAVARVVAFAMLFTSLFYVEKWFFGKVQIKFWLGLLVMLGAAAILSFIVQELTIENFPLKWIWLLISTGAGGIVYCLTLFLLGYVTADEKALLRSLVKRP